MSLLQKFRAVFKKSPNAKSASTPSTGMTRKRASGKKAELTVNSFSVRRGKAAFAGFRGDFYEDLAEALEDRAVLVEELKKHMRRAQRRHSPLASLYALWLKRMDSLSFSNAMKGTVPPMDSLVLLAAETSGRLPQGLRFLAFSVRSMGKIKGQIIGAVAVPVIIAHMIYGMLVGFGKFMVPILTQILPESKWPILGKMVYNVSMAALHYSIPLFALAIASIVGFFWALPNWYGPTRRKFDNYLPFSLYRDYNSAIMLVSLSGLMQSGSSLVGSLRAMRAASPQWMAWHLSQTLYNLDKDSATPAKAFDTGVMPQELYDRVCDYGERSSFQEGLTKIGNQALDKVEKGVQKKAKIINYILLAISGMTMALVIASVMLTAQQARVELTRATAVR